MEHIEILTKKTKLSWIDKRCRQFVLSVLAKINYGQLELIEADQHYYFPENCSDTDVQAKILIHDVSVYRDFVRGGSIGAAEAYIAGKWSSPNLTK